MYSFMHLTEQNSGGTMKIVLKFLSVIRRTRPQFKHSQNSTSLPVKS